MPKKLWNVYFVGHPLFRDIINFLNTFQSHLCKCDISSKFDMEYEIFCYVNNLKITLGYLALQIRKDDEMIRVAYWRLTTIRLSVDRWIGRYPHWTSVGVFHWWQQQKLAKTSNFNQRRKKQTMCLVTAAKDVAVSNFGLIR